MSKAAELAKWGEVSTNGQVSGRRNIIINGAMKVAQRSTSVAALGAAAGYFTLDRWNIATGSSAGRLTMTQTADGPSGFANCLKLDCTTADTSIAAGEFMKLEQRFEGQDLQAIGKGVAGAKEITVSFYVKANAAFTFGVELYDIDNQRQITKLFDTTTGWVRHEITFPADVDDGSSPFDDDNAQSMQIGFWIHAGSTFTGGTLNTASWADNTNANRAAGIDSFYSSTDNNFFITGVQLEVGSVATPFEHRSFGEELALCQRYFQRTYAYGTATGTATTVGALVGSMAVTHTFGDAGGTFKFPVVMRAAPTITLFSTTNASTTGKISADSTDGTGVASFISEAGFFPHRNSDNGGTAVNVFMRTHITAEGEL
jgi:hypothetical protein